MYVAKMHDGNERELQHNIIAKNLYSQWALEGRQYQFLLNATQKHINTCYLMKYMKYVVLEKQSRNDFDISRGMEDEPVFHLVEIKHV